MFPAKVENGFEANAAVEVTVEVDQGEGGVNHVHNLGGEPRRLKSGLGVLRCALLNI